VINRHCELHIYGYYLPSYVIRGHLSGALSIPPYENDKSHFKYDLKLDWFRTKQGSIAEFCEHDNDQFSMGKVKLPPPTPWRQTKGVVEELLSFLNSVIGGRNLSHLRPGRFTPVKEPRYPLNRKLGGPQSWSGQFCRREKVLPLPGLEHRTVQDVASAYTDYDIPAPSGFVLSVYFFLQSEIL
jgi:hypothetical protein